MDMYECIFACNIPPILIVKKYKWFKKLKQIEYDSIYRNLSLTDNFFWSSLEKAANYPET